MTLPSQIDESAVLRKVAWRLIPFMGLMYLLAFLDRVNIGFAALTMNADLAFSAQVFGNGAGILFLGYVLFEVPSNLALHRFGARRWIARIMISWGLLSAAMSLIDSPSSFYLLRFLLGAAEAGFFPGMILYLTYWFPSHYRGRILGAFLIFLPLASVIGAPISTALLDLNAAGLKGWQWLFILEGLPAALIGVIALYVLTDRPEHARWLSESECSCLVNLLAAERKSSEPGATALAALTDRTVWFFGLIYFSVLVALYGFTFWLPQLIQGLGALSHRQIGALTVVPNLAAAVLMYCWARRSDQTQERRWHIAWAAFMGAAGLALAAGFIGSPMVIFIGLVIAAIGIYSMLPVFWTFPTATLNGTAAAAGIALINSIGNLGGYFGPYLMGYLKHTTSGHQNGLGVLAGCLLIAGLLSLRAAGSPQAR